MNRRQNNPAPVNDDNIHGQIKMIERHADVKKTHNNAVDKEIEFS